MITMLAGKNTKLIVVVICLIVLFGITSAATPRVHAAPSVSQITCHGSTCNGLAPAATGCWGAHAYIVLSAYINGSSQQGIVELWYSSDCQTNWTNVRSNVGCGSYILSEQAIISRKAGVDGAAESYSGFGEQSDCTDHTPMVWAPDVPAASTGVIFEDVGSWSAQVQQDGF